MLVTQTNPVRVQLFSYVNTFFCHVGEPNKSCESSTLFLCKHFLAMLVNQTNPVRVQLFSYVNTFFCHVGEPDQSCESSTLFLCKHFLLGVLKTKTPKTPKTPKLENKDPQYFSGLRNYDQPVAKATES